LDALLYDLPCVIARLRFHLGELTEICYGLFDPLLEGFSLFQRCLSAGGILDGRPTLLECFQQDLIAPIDKRPDAFKRLLASADMTFDLSQRS